MDEHTTGLILRTRPLTETSLIVHWLTPDFGRVATVAKGARRPKSPFRGKLDLFFQADFSFQRSRRSDLHQLREVVLRQTNCNLRQELRYLRQAAYGVNLLEQTTETDTPLPALFQLFQEFLGHLPKASPNSWPVHVLEMKLFVELGLTPCLKQANLSPGAQQLLARLTTDSWLICERLRPSSLQLSEIRTYLHDFLLTHLDRIPPSREAAVRDSL